jgi:hypothetical protein
VLNTITTTHHNQQQKITLKKKAYNTFSRMEMLKLNLRGIRTHNFSGDRH